MSFMSMCAEGDTFHNSHNSNVCQVYNVYCLAQCVLKSTNKNDTLLKSGVLYWVVYKRFANIHYSVQQQKKCNRFIKQADYLQLN